MREKQALGGFASRRRAGRSARAASVALLFVLVLSPGCEAIPGRPGQQSLTWPRPVEFQDLPAAYSVEEIRRACPPGRTDRFLMEVPGGPDHHEEMEFLTSEEWGADIASRTFAVDGTPLGGESVVPGIWQEFWFKAKFPAEREQVTDEWVQTPAGTFECWVFEVDTPEGRERYHFAKSLPGPPVRMTRHVGGELETRITLIGHEPGGAAE